MMIKRRRKYQQVKKSTLDESMYRPNSRDNSLMSPRRPRIKHEHSARQIELARSRRPQALSKIEDQDITSGVF